MITVEVNTSLLTTKFKLVLSDNSQMKAVLEEIAKKVGETFLNPKQYVLVPVIKNSQYSPDKKNNSRSNSKNSREPKLDYDTNYIDMNMYVRNLKTSTVELNEKVYVDKPVKRNKDVPIEN